MTLTYTCETPIIELALQKLKDTGLVSTNAYFNYDAPQQLRREVTYRDYLFLSRLSRTAEVETVRSILAWLKRDEAGAEARGTFRHCRDAPGRANGSTAHRRLPAPLESGGRFCAWRSTQQHPGPPGTRGLRGWPGVVRRQILRFQRHRFGPDG